jgi:hypothetical protein
VERHAAREAAWQAAAETSDSTGCDQRGFGHPETEPCIKAAKLRDEFDVVPPGSAL